MAGNRVPWVVVLLLLAGCSAPDECVDQVHDCDENATCETTREGFSCTCEPGYEGDGVTCTDLDECSLQTDSCSDHATCSNTPGAFECSCDAGYEGDGVTCTDIDECATNNGGCGDPATVGCTNTPGGYSCAGLHYYVCDCETGADPDCVAGSDTNPGTNSSAPWQTVAAGFGQFSSLPAGGSIQFCQGGAFQVGTEGGTRLVNSTATAAVPVSLTDYQPTWASGDEGRPVLHQEELGYGVITLQDSGYPEHHEGVLVENLELRATTGTGFGIFMSNDQDHVLIDNVLIDGFDIGVYSAGSNECASSDPGCDRDNESITLRSSTITNNTSQGWLGGGDHILIENNHFEGNGTNTNRDHNIYISGHPKTDGKLYTENYQIIGNTLYRSALDTSGACIGAPIVGHGNMRDVLIEGNLVYEDIGKAGGGCWGIAIDGGYSSAETLENVIIRGNYLYNVGNLSIGVGSCVDCIIENNVISNEQSLSLTAIGTSLAPGIGDALTENLVVRNNSIYLAGTGRTYPISISAGEGDNYTIVSNTIEYQGPTPDIWQHDFACLFIEDVSEMTEVDYNLCEFQAGAYAGWYWWGASGTTGHTLSLQGWQLQEGFGMNSVQASPGYTAPTSPQFDLSPSSSTSPLIGAGHPTLSSTTDILGNTRDAAPDIGAFEGP